MRIREDRGVGTTGMVFALPMFLAFLFLAVHVLVGLFATSTVTAVAHDVARDMASPDIHADPALLDRLAADAEDRLGGLDAEVTWELAQPVGGQPTHLVVLIVADPPGLLPARVGDIGVTEIRRSVRVKLEAFVE